VAPGYFLAGQDRVADRVQLELLRVLHVERGPGVGALGYRSSATRGIPPA